MLDRASTVWVLVVLLAPVIAVGQTQESFEGFMSGIRANAVKGEVLFRRDSWKFPLESGLKLEEGDFVHTSKDSYAELLLQPGNYMRVGGDTEFQIFSEQHDRMRLKLNDGAIVIELLAHETSHWGGYEIEESTELIRVITPDAEVLINHPGIFRINATTGGRTELVVREGEAVLNGYRVKKKRRAVAAKGSVARAEVDSRIEDDFDVWSRERAAQVVKANKLLKNEPPWAKRARNADTSVEVPDNEEEDNTRGRVISARPGTVNFVEPGVEFSRTTNEWEQLTEKSQLESGDSIRTNANSLVELIMFPDMHLRLNGSSEVLLDQLSNESIALKVVRGSAILDVARFDRKLVPQITIGGPSTSVVINDRGNYRVDAGGDNNAITVRDGKVILNERSIGGCKRLEGETISDCDKKLVDNFDYWSQHRGEGELYNGRVMVATVTHLARLRQYRFKNTGFWYQKPGQTSYTFVPFTSQLFRSPYGGHYSTVLAPRRSSINRIEGGVRPPNPNRPRGPEVARPMP
jgi:hypothetical protein